MVTTRSSSRMDVRFTNEHDWQVGVPMPTVEVRGMPSSAASSSITLTDASRNGLLHWVLVKNHVANTKTVGKNYTGRATYQPPSPPPGEQHRYVLRVRAYDNGGKLIREASRVYKFPPDSLTK